MNSRVHAFRELQSVGRFQQDLAASGVAVGALFTELTPFFTNPEMYYLSGECVDELVQRAAMAMWPTEKALRRDG